MAATVCAVAVYWHRGAQRSTRIVCTSPPHFLREVEEHRKYLESLVRLDRCDGYVILLEGEFSHNAKAFPVTA